MPGMKMMSPPRGPTRLQLSLQHAAADREGGCSAAVGQWIQFRNAELARSIAGLGGDFVIIDCERGRIGTAADLALVVDAVAAAGASPIVRVLASEQKRIRVIDVEIVITAQAERAVVATGCPSPRFVVVVEIDSRRAVENVDDIAAVPGIDALFVGPHPLISPGGSSDADNIPIAASADAVLAAARRHANTTSPVTAAAMATLTPASAAALARLRAYKPPPTQYFNVPLARRAAVLILLFADRRGDLRVVLTMRAAGMNTYAGHAALPGGRADAPTETPFQTARREAWEEIGLPLADEKLPSPFRVEHLCQMPANLARTELAVRPEGDDGDALSDPPKDALAAEEERFRVFGMTARILVDAARVAYDEEPRFEHNSHFGDEDMIARLLRMGRLSAERRKGDVLTREVLREAAKL
ncbi:putative nudix domain-containing protein [Diplodia seriata]|uniref:Putative nudix domain-containing protein n=1 Tax=Diplodia seriata TaxID=420778 RepID=A0A0G2ENH5_9PEZI|nr:putative nudix domain-containing protein [Diplodia seriata]